MARQAGKRSALVGGERGGPRLLERGQPAALALDLSQCRLEPPLERAHDQAVLGLAGVELAAGPLGLEVEPLEGEPLAGDALRVLALELIDRPRRGPHAGRGDRLQEGPGDRPVDPQAAERLQARSVACS